jgi:hypothetical protein
MFHTNGTREPPCMITALQNLHQLLIKLVKKVCEMSILCLLWAYKNSTSETKFTDDVGMCKNDLQIKVKKYLYVT